MRKLVMCVLFMAGLVQAGTGCIITSDDDDDGGDGNTPPGVLIAITWLCPPDADTVAVTASPAGSSTSLPTDRFACGEGALNLRVDAGSWDVEVQPEGSAGQFLGLTQTITGVDFQRVPIDFAFPDTGGFFFLTWTIDQLAAADGCNPGEQVEVIATFADDPSAPLVADFPCDVGAGVAPNDDDAGWPIGDYTLDVALIDASNQPISVPDPVTGVSINFPDELFDIGDLDLVPEA